MNSTPVAPAVGAARQGSQVLFQCAGRQLRSHELSLQENALDDRQQALHCRIALRSLPYHPTLNTRFLKPWLTGQG